jgi:hypothetical protein
MEKYFATQIFTGAVLIYSKKFLQAATTTKFLPQFKFGSQKLTETLNKHSKIEKIFPYLGLLNNIELGKHFVIGDENDKPCPMYVGFSSNGVSGIWDIGTMSIRGASSCMHFENSHSSHLVGSMLDPFVGIIYLSKLDRTDYGISFNKRAVVRLLIGTDYSDKTKYILYVERIYTKTDNTNPFVYKNNDCNPDLIDGIFRKYLSKRCRKDIPILSSMTSVPYGLTSIPNDISVELDRRYKSFSDAMIRDIDCNKERGSEALKIFK